MARRGEFAEDIQEYLWYEADYGTHEELMAADGLYANLCRVQSTAVTIEERLDEMEVDAAAG